MVTGASYESPRLAPVGVVLAGCLLLAAAWAGFWLRTRQPAADPRAAEPPALLDRADLVGPAPPLRVAVAGNASIEVQVVDEQGAAVAGARAVAFQRTANRRLPAGPGDVVGQGDASGTMQLAPVQASARPVIHAPGHASVRLGDEHFSSARSARVVLPRHHEVVFVCVRNDGRPLAGARLALGQVSLPPWEELDQVRGDEIPLADPVLAVYSAESDAAGVARIDSVPAGDYSLRAQHPDAVILDRELGGTVTVPGPPRTLPFSRVRVLVAECDLPVVSGNTRPVAVNRKTGGRSQEAQARLLAGLQARYPDALVLVDLPGEAPAAAATVAASFLVADRGWVDAELPWQWLDEGIVPTRVDAAAGTERREFADLRVELNAPGGSRPYAPCRVVVTSAEPAAWNRAIGSAVRAGQALRLPPGRYRLASLDAVEQVAIGKLPAFEVVAGRDNLYRAELPLELRCCRVSVAAGGIPFRKAFVSLVDERRSGVAGMLVLPGGSPHGEVVMPCSRVRVSARIWGFGQVEQIVDVQPGAEPLPVVLAFEGTRP